MALEVYKVTQDFPEEEEFGLILQMRKAAVGVPAQIANGFERRNIVAKLALYREARASVEELRYYFILCRDLGYTLNFDQFAEQGEQLARMVGGLVGSIARLDPGDRGGRRRGPRDIRRGRDIREQRTGDGQEPHAASEGHEPSAGFGGEADAGGEAQGGELI
jgi:four helix bundle protein